MKPGKSTDDLIALIKKEGGKKIDGYTKMQILVKGLFHNALPKNESGRIAASGEGDMDLKAAQFLLNYAFGKPAEQKFVQIDLFKHLMEGENAIEITDYKVEELQ